MTKLIKYIFLTLFFILPLTFTMQNSELFEFPKIITVYLFTLILFTLHLINHFDAKVPLFVKNRLSLIFFVFLLSQIISTIFSIDRHMSIFGYYSRFNGGLLSVVCFFFLFQILSVYIDKDFTQKIINTSILSALFVCLYAIAQHFGVDRHLWVQDVQARVFSTFGQPNWLAAYLCITLCFVLQKLDQNQSSYGMVLNHSLLFIIYLSLIFTKSKSGLIASSIPLSFYFFNTIKSKKYGQGITLSLLIFLPLLIFPNPIKQMVRTGYYPVPPNQENSKIENSYNITASEDIRKIVWQGAFNLWKKFPLFGTGLETFAISYYWVRPLSHNLTSEWDFLYNKAHNEYLNFAATTGTFGLLTYVVFILFSFFSLLQKPYLLLAYLTILITNFAGFSVTVISLYFFLIPVFFQQAPSPSKLKKPKKYLIYPLIPISLYILYSILAYFMADRNYFQSRQYLEKYPQISLEKNNLALKLRPHEPEYLIQSAEILATLGQKDQAIENLIKAEAISPFHPNYLKKTAQILFSLKDYQSAVNTIQKTTVLAPTDAKSLYILGYFNQSLGRTQEAIEAYQTAITLKSNYDHAHFYLAQIYFDQKDYQNALTHFQEALNINPKNTDAKNYINEIENLTNSPSTNL